MQKVKNAVILAAGRSFSFAPFSYETPKALFKVHGETLIERQIRQLREAGVENIAVVIGHMREKMFFLEDKYGVTLISNSLYGSRNNIWSLYLAKDFLSDCFLCFCDNYYPENLFLKHDDSSRSYRIVVRRDAGEKEFAAELDADGRITSVLLNRDASYSLVGFAYFNADFAGRFIRVYEENRKGFSVDRFFWEEFVGQNLSELPLYGRLEERHLVLEFDSVEDVREYDPDLIENLNSVIADNICSTLNCTKGEISNIKAISKGLTNVSFIFQVGDRKYVYRHPGGTSSTLVDRTSEHFSQTLGSELGIDGTLVYIHPTDGWKITRYVEEAYDFSYEDTERLHGFMRMVRKLHLSGAVSHYEFRLLDFADGLLRLACNVNSSLAQEFSQLRSKVHALYEYTSKDGFGQCVCHGDVYYPNFLVSKSEMHLIDWEYTGMCDPAHDFASVVSRDDYFDSEEKMQQLLEMYLDRKPTYEEWRHFFGFIPVSAWYWFCWSLFKDSVNENNGYFMLNSYRKCVGFVDRMLNEYIEKDLKS